MTTIVAEKQYLTTGEAASIMGVTVQKVRALCELGRLPAVNTSAATRPRWTIRRVDLEAFLTPGAAKPEPPKPEPARQRRRRLDSGVRKVF